MQTRWVVRVSGNGATQHESSHRTARAAMRKLYKLTSAYIPGALHYLIFSPQGMTGRSLCDVYAEVYGEQPVRRNNGLAFPRLWGKQP